MSRWRGDVFIEKPSNLDTTCWAGETKSFRNPKELFSSRTNQIIIVAAACLHLLSFFSRTRWWSLSSWINVKSFFFFWSKNVTSLFIGEAKVNRQISFLVHQKRKREISFSDVLLVFWCTVGEFVCCLVALEIKDHI